MGKGDAVRADTPSLAAIDGLCWHERWRVPNGGASFVVPFPRIRPATIVFHGAAPFSYGHFGIHLGQQDRLTFLGEPDRIITAMFLDCRKGSRTFGTRLEVCFAPSSRWELAIPAGVAHGFDGLEEIATLNAYDLFLPDPDHWLDGTTAWDSDTDVVNLPLDVADDAVPAIEANPNPASDVYYRIVAGRQAAVIPDGDFAYPYTYRHEADDGRIYDLKITERADRVARPAWEAIGDIAGLGWASNPVLASGPSSGFVPLTDCRPFYIVDHGHDREYTHDAFGIHLGQEDRLVFLGPSSRRAHVVFVDCRRGSETLHREVATDFMPDATRTLVIPPGVAHRFETMEGIYTLNQGRIFLDAAGAYQPGTDVIDWPVADRPYPKLDTHAIPADDAYYARLVEGQVTLRRSGLANSTTAVLMAEDSDGNMVRVAITPASATG